MDVGQRMGWAAGKRVGLWLVWMLVTFSALPVWGEDAAPKQKAPNPEVLYREGLEALKADDLVASVGFFRKAAEAGHFPSMVKLAESLDLSEENQEAVEWYEKAARAGNPEGALGLGQMLTGGDVGTERVKEGVEWIRKAAEQRSGAAVVALAGIMASGRYGEKVDPEGALKLLNDAAAKGDVPSMKELVKVYEGGLMGQKADPNKVRQLEVQIRSAKTSAGAKP